MLFVIADSLIGVNKFAVPFAFAFAYAYAVPMIVTIYFTGQLLIGVGEWGAYVGTVRGPAVGPLKGLPACQLGSEECRYSRLNRGFYKG